MTDLPALERLRAAGLALAEIEQDMVAAPVPDRIDVAGARMSRVLTDLQQILASLNHPVDSEVRAAVQVIRRQSARLSAVVASAVEYCDIRIKLVSIPQSGYSPTGEAIRPFYANQITVEG